MTDRGVHAPAHGPSEGTWSVATCSAWWATPMASPALADLLDATERRTVFGLAREEDRDRYITAHALARLLLAAKTGHSAAELRFERTCGRCGGRDHGKPRLAQAGRSELSGSFAFNLSHAGNRVVVAVAEGQGDHERFDVGVDVERIPDPEEEVFPSGGAGILTPAELSVYRRLDRAQRGHALAVWWTRKEAVLKAYGLGLAVPPWSVEVTAPDAAPMLARWTPDDDRDSLRSEPRPALPRPGSTVALRSLNPGPGYVGCLAVVGATSIAWHEHDADHLLGAA